MNTQLIIKKLEDTGDILQGHILNKSGLKYYKQRKNFEAGIKFYWRFSIDIEPYIFIALHFNLFGPLVMNFRNAHMLAKIDFWEVS